MRAWPAQKSIVSFATVIAAVGAPDVGSQSLGCPMPPLISSRPHASTLPVGSSEMWSGTMLHAIGGPHSPLFASAGSAESAIADEVAVASEPVNWMV